VLTAGAHWMTDSVAGVLMPAPLHAFCLEPLYICAMNQGVRAPPRLYGSIRCSK
jgi:hypothetical protein